MNGVNFVVIIFLLRLGHLCTFLIFLLFGAVATFVIIIRIVSH